MISKPSFVGLTFEPSRRRVRLPVAESHGNISSCRGFKFHCRVLAGKVPTLGRHLPCTHPDGSHFPFCFASGLLISQILGQARAAVCQEKMLGTACQLQCATGNTRCACVCVCECVCVTVWCDSLVAQFGSWQIVMRGSSGAFSLNRHGEHVQDEW